jgi:mRNA-degrading endonuclease RelE of RelBE toxin-antitoxin system
MKIFQSRSFEKKVKKFKKSEKKALDEAIHQVVKKPDIGEEKKGDLRGVYIFKFKIKTLQYLLSYRFIDGDLELIMIGPHENYYRDLKSYLKSR